MRNQGRLIVYRYTKQLYTICINITLWLMSSRTATFQFFIFRKNTHICFNETSSSKVPSLIWLTKFWLSFLKQTEPQLQQKHLQPHLNWKTDILSLLWLQEGVSLNIWFSRWLKLIRLSKTRYNDTVTSRESLLKISVKWTLVNSCLQGRLDRTIGQLTVTKRLGLLILEEIMIWRHPYNNNNNKLSVTGFFVIL